jgi:ATP/maltotriose-dependent transcriptional regulator MalT
VVAKARVAGLRGEEEAAAALIEETERIARPIRDGSVLALAQQARGLTALGSGLYAEAYTSLRSSVEAAQPGRDHGRTISFAGAVGYLAEAAVRSGHRDDARVVLAQLESVAVRAPSPGLLVGMRHARALLADDVDGEALYQAALRSDVARWPFAHARLQLAYGTWLRRHRRIAESRAPLRAARETFDALGAALWGEQARQELRAAGEASPRRTPNTLDRLTPQELQIARMAAEGLSNREIGQQLYLSHRTVGSHLYRIFPKLGITQRAELRTTFQVGGPVSG